MLFYIVYSIDLCTNGSVLVVYLCPAGGTTNDVILPVSVTIRKEVQVWNES